MLRYDLLGGTAGRSGKRAGKGLVPVLTFKSLRVLAFFVRMTHFEECRRKKLRACGAPFFSRTCAARDSYANAAYDRDTWRGEYKFFAFWALFSYDVTSSGGVTEVEIFLLKKWRDLVALITTVQAIFIFLRAEAARIAIRRRRGSKALPHRARRVRVDEAAAAAARSSPRERFERTHGTGLPPQ